MSVDMLGAVSRLNMVQDTLYARGIGNTCLLHVQLFTIQTRHRNRMSFLLHQGVCARKQQRNAHHLYCCKCAVTGGRSEAECDSLRQQLARAQSQAASAARAAGAAGGSGSSGSDDLLKKVCHISSLTLLMDTHRLTQQREAHVFAHPL
eukprot:scaffold59287_cov21-Tisochrysis_lutea.AAC.2